MEWPRPERRRRKKGCDAHREQAQAQGVESHRGFGDQPIRAGTYEAYRPGMGSTEHIKEKGGTHHREDDASADHAMHAHSGCGVIWDAPRHTGEAQSVHRQIDKDDATIAYLRVA